MTEVRVLSYEGWKTVPKDVIQEINHLTIYSEQRYTITLINGKQLSGLAQIYTNNELVFAGFLSQSSAS